MVFSIDFPFPFIMPNITLQLPESVYHSFYYYPRVISIGHLISSSVFTPTTFYLFGLVSYEFARRYQPENVR